MNKLFTYLYKNRLYTPDEDVDGYLFIFSTFEKNMYGKF